MSIVRIIRQREGVCIVQTCTTMPIPLLLYIYIRSRLIKELFLMTRTLNEEREREKEKLEGKDLVSMASSQTKVTRKESKRHRKITHTKGILPWVVGGWEDVEGETISRLWLRLTKKHPCFPPPSTQTHGRTIHCDPRLAKRNAVKHFLLRNKKQKNEENVIAISKGEWKMKELSSTTKTPCRFFFVFFFLSLDAANLQKFEFERFRKVPTSLRFDFEKFATLEPPWGSNSNNSKVKVSDISSSKISKFLTDRSKNSYISNSLKIEVCEYSKIFDFFKV